MITLSMILVSNSQNIVNDFPLALPARQRGKVDVWNKSFAPRVLAACLHEVEGFSSVRETQYHSRFRFKQILQHVK